MIRKGINRIAVMKKLIILGLLALLAACTSDNEHFCVRYKYVYDQLDEPGIAPYSEIEVMLRKELKDPSKDHNYTRIMLFVLDEHRTGIKPEYEDAKDYCMRRQRWKAYR